MFRLQEDNITGTVLKHMIHCEDLVLRGQAGCNLAVRALKGFYSKIKTGQSDMTVTQKIDGAPAVVAASDFYGTQFIALKHSWDKGKIFKSETEIIEAYPDRPELVSKLTSIFKYLPLIEIPKNEIWMGDFLYSREDLKVRDINEEKYITFCPNTLVYAVLADSPLGKRINRTEAGIAWHTRYSGQKDFLKMSFDVSVKELRQVPAIFQIDATLPEPKNRLETEDLSDIDYGFKELDYSIEDLIKADGYLTLCENPKAVLLLDTFRNAQIKEGNENLIYEQLQAWVENRFEKEAQTKKTEKGQATVLARKNEMLGVLEPRLISNIYKVQNIIISLKEQLISLQNKQMPIQTFIEKTDGTLEPASGEGYAVSDIDGNIQKMVSRLGFSRANFSPDVKKGWMSDRRAEKENQIAETKTNGTSWLTRILETRQIDKQALEDELRTLVDQAQQWAQDTDDPGYLVNLTEVNYPDGNINYAMPENVSSAESHAHRKAAYQKFIDYCSKLNKENPDIQYETDWHGQAGEHNDYLVVKRNGQRLGSIRLRQPSTRVGGVRKVDATNILRAGTKLTGISWRFDESKKWMILDFSFDNNPQKAFASIVFDGAMEVYGPNSLTVSPDALNLYKYFFLDLPDELISSEKIPTHGYPDYIYNILKNEKNKNLTSTLAELLNVWLILTNKDFNGQSLVPDEDGYQGLVPAIVKWPNNASSKFIDTIIELINPENPAIKKPLRISSKDGTNGSSGSPAITATLAMLPELDSELFNKYPDNHLSHFYDIVNQARNSFSKIRDKYQETLNCFFREAAMSYWLYGAEKIGLGNVSNPEDLEKLLCHYIMFYNIYKANGNISYNLTPRSSGQAYKAEDFLAPNGIIYLNYQKKLNEYLSNEKNRGCAINGKISDIPPYYFCSLFMKITVADLRNDRLSVQILGDILGQLDYYQYKLTFPKTTASPLKLQINKAGKVNQELILIDKSICTTNSAKSWDLNSQGGAIIIKGQTA